MELIHADDVFSISWYDSTHKIVLAHIHKRWNWADADRLFTKMDEIFLSFTHDAYSIYAFDPAGREHLSRRQVGAAKYA